MKNQENDTFGLTHTKWNCKYHVVFAPKYRRKVFYEEKRIEIGAILRELCRWKGVEIIEANAPYSYVGNNTAEAECKQIHGDTQREE